MAFLAGLLLGLSMILPIGPQNLFVLQSGLAGGVRRGMLAAVTAGCCDTVLIFVGAAGVSAVSTRVPVLRLALLWAGVAFLVYLGVSSFRHGPVVRGEAATGERRAPLSPVRQVVAGMGVSWGNPHAILDTVAVLGSAIAAQGGALRIPFTAGAVTASWVFFLALATVGGIFGARLPTSAEGWIRGASGVMMLAFAIVLGVEAVRSLPIWK